MITAAFNFLKEKNNLCLDLGNIISFFKEKICLTTVPISIELSKYKGVWKGEKIKPMGTAIANIFLSYIKL